MTIERPPASPSTSPSSPASPKHICTGTTRIDTGETVAYTYERFDRRRQLQKLLLRSLARWLITVVLCASIYGVLISYSSHEALAQRRRLEFNTFVIALTIALGLNIASSLKANAVELQWWLLSLHHYGPREADLILSSGHFTVMLQLGWTTRRMLIWVFVTLFVTLNIGSQVALALLGITYNINPADKFAITKPGLVSIADLSDIQGTKVLATSAKHQNLTEDINSRRYAANMFGQIGLGFSETTVDKIPRPGALYTSDALSIYSSFSLPSLPDDSDSDNTPEAEAENYGNSYSYTYVFFETNVLNDSYAGIVASNRTVTVNASCDSYKVVAGGNGMSTNITVHFDDGDGQVYPPVANGGSQIMYLHDPAAEANDTWSQVSAFEPSADSQAWFYVCQVNLGNVTNGVVPAHYMGANFSRYVPPAIALQGYGSSTDGLTANASTNYQFQSYPSQTYFGRAARGRGVRMAALVSRYAINALASCALANANVDARGMTPLRAIQLEVTRWRYVHVIVGLTVGVQLLVHLAAVLVANRVQVREQRSLATASLIRPLLVGVDDRARVASGRQIAKMIGENVTVRYEPVGAGYDLCIYRDGELKGLARSAIDR
ncbi:hypothetical protein ISF_05756 [Cordyceps fumosorosea ARSEF 2679]|uniref:Uncharacterized protein n=1 Tax=Cordyceps fumosorosea (strain ARSEF 2679) TaxID=1081104 RepID=A0A167TLB8_CORFA|nr:hypothetical protein ISF_05756 [Cordyceps fumosorosea ARSEF 2679]OAA60717.1 hypothetical protein ISF_05756 [Cordyceps fumosorosea ARSEF 2679]